MVSTLDTDTDPTHLCLFINIVNNNLSSTPFQICVIVRIDTEQKRLKLICCLQGIIDYNDEDDDDDEEEDEDV